MLCEWRLWSQPRGAGQGARAAAAAEVRQEGKGTPKVGGTAWGLGASRNDRGNHRVKSVSGCRLGSARATQLDLGTTTTAAKTISEKCHALRLCGMG
jgi:hypothetical protein